MCAAFAAPDGRRSALAALQRALCHARWLAVRELCAIYPVTPAGGAPSAQLLPAGGLATPPRAPAGGSWDARLAAANGGAAAASLALAGVPLEPLRVSTLPTEPAARERVAAALGYAAAVVALLERILGVRLPCKLRSAHGLAWMALTCTANRPTQVPLRYGVAARGSRSAVWDRGDVALLRGAPPLAQGAQGAPPQRVWYPLYTDGCVARA